MRRIKNFYQGKRNAGFHNFEELLEISDYKLQKLNYFWNFLYPKNITTNIKIEFNDKKHPEKSENVRKEVIRGTKRIMSLFGYEIIGDEKKSYDVQRVKDLYREENNTIIGLFNTKNFPRITQVLKFLNAIEMKELSALFFLMILRAIEEDAEFKKLIKNSFILMDWIKTQPYIDAQQAYDKILGEEMEDWEKAALDFEKQLGNPKKQSDAW